MRDFLEATGFKQVKECSIPFGRSYLVVMSSDEEPEESRWKRFPLKIDVTGILAFRIYFSLDDAAVTGKGRFPAAAIRLLAKLNLILPVGYYNYASGSNQIQLTLKLHYKALSPADLTASIRAYYDAVILYYKGTVASLGTLHRDIEGANKSVSQVTDYYMLVQEDMQGEYQWQKLVYAEGEQQTDLELLQTLTAREELTRYLLPKPIYKQDSRGVYVKVSRQLTPVVEYIQKNLHMQDYLYKLILEMFSTMGEIGIFPTFDMIFCSANSPIQLILVPGKGLHQNREMFLQNLTQSGLSMLSYEKKTTNNQDCLLMGLNWDLFEVPTSTSLDEILLGKVKLGAQDCLLYRLNESPRKPEFAENFANYASAMGRLKTYPNALQGWTEAPADLLENTVPESSLGSQYYLCEHYEYIIWRGNDLIATLCQVGSLLQALHSQGDCHWFISPLTIRQQYRGSRETAVVLPTLKPVFSGFIYSFLPKKYHKFIAPEVKRYIKEGMPVGSIYAADVYSFCQVVASKVTISPEKTELQALGEAVTRGRGEEWRDRPALNAVLELLEGLRMT